MMMPERQRRSLIAFFLGSTAAKLDVTDPKLVEIVSRRAYRDLSRTLHGMRTHPEAARILQGTHHALRDFLVKVERVSTRKDFDNLHDQWCTETIERFSAAPHPQREFGLSYGQAQKWLNMTMKYFAVLGHPLLEAVYPFLHVPVDSIIYKQAASFGVPRPQSTAWSRLDRNQYKEYQNRLREKIHQACGTSYAPLDWEVDAWIERSSL